MNWEKTQAFIVNYKVNQVALSAEIGINQGTFSDKMKQKRGAKFTPEQQEKITAYIKKMGKEAGKL